MCISGFFGKYTDCFCGYNYLKERNTEKYEVCNKNCTGEGKKNTKIYIYIFVLFDVIIVGIRNERDKRYNDFDLGFIVVRISLYNETKNKSE